MSELPFSPEPSSLLPQRHATETEFKHGRWQGQAIYVLRHVLPVRLRWHFSINHTELLSLTVYWSVSDLTVEQQFYLLELDPANRETRILHVLERLLVSLARSH